jgi:hypothetical protein
VGVAFFFLCDPLQHIGIFALRPSRQGRINVILRNLVPLKRENFFFHCSVVLQGNVTAVS